MIRTGTSCAHSMEYAHIDPRNRSWPFLGLSEAGEGHDTSPKTLWAMPFQDATSSHVYTGAMEVQGAPTFTSGNEPNHPGPPCD